MKTQESLLIKGTTLCLTIAGYLLNNKHDTSIIENIIVKIYILFGYYIV